MFETTKEKVVANEWEPPCRVEHEPESRSVLSAQLGAAAESSLLDRSAPVIALKSIQRKLDKSSRQVSDQRQQIEQCKRRQVPLLPNQPVANETGIPISLKSGLENLSGFSLAGVRVHYNSPKPARLNALAYTQGLNIEIGPGQEKHLPHEAWHVVQQMQGRVSPTTEINGVAVNDDSTLECEADVMGARASQVTNSTQNLTNSTLGISTPLQTKLKSDASTKCNGRKVDVHSSSASKHLDELSQNTDERTTNEVEHDSSNDGIDTSADLDDLVENGGVSVTIGGDRHLATVRIENGEPELGVQSAWTNMNSMKHVLLRATRDTDGEIAGRGADVERIFIAAETKKRQLRTARAAGIAFVEAAKICRQRDRTLAATELAELINNLSQGCFPSGLRARGTGVRGRLCGVGLAFQKLHDELSNQPTLLGNFPWLEFARRIRWAKDRAIRQVRLALNASHRCTGMTIADAWEEFGEFLPAHLVPASAVFGDRTMSEDPAEKSHYHSGKSNDRIPVVWYKDEGEYPEVSFENNNYRIDQKNLVIQGVSYHVAEVPSIGTELQKLAHHSDRSNQRAYNAIFNQYVTIGGIDEPLTQKGGYDGDHVIDLGFGGKDINTNYWPLPAEANRRAFHGYNSRYIVNYKDDQDNLKARAIGGLIGKHFIIKKIETRAVPVESGTAKAGTSHL